MIFLFPFIFSMELYFGWSLGEEFRQHENPFEFKTYISIFGCQEDIYFRKS